MTSEFFFFYFFVRVNNNNDNKKVKKKDYTVGGKDSYKLDLNLEVKIFNLLLKDSRNKGYNGEKR